MPSGSTPRKSLSIVVPVFNEEECIPELIRRCLAVARGLGRPFELVLVDDGSKDSSPEAIEAAALGNPEVVGVLLSGNYGQHAAVMAGFAHTRGDVVVTLDADLQNPPEEIPRLLAAIEQGYDVVGTVRVARQDKLLRKLASRLANRTIRAATGAEMSDYGCMLRAYKRPIVDAMLQCRERSVFIPILANSFARRTTEIEVEHAERLHGHSQYDLWKLIRLQFDLLTSTTTWPLKMLTLLGGLTALAGFTFALVLLAMRLLQGPEWAAQGVFTLFAVLFVFVGGQFMAMGLLGEYIGRIYHARIRPPFVVRDTVRSSEQLRPETLQPRPPQVVRGNPPATV
jgi:undecaprenyl-phosphate 4-deoxy-4-formamido-L-arabinose transferase